MLSSTRTRQRRWALGLTGLPLIDAGMRELLATGYMSNRCRQNCASVLAKDLRLDWRYGAEFFQWLLIDHDIGSNWGNWRYFSGVGADPKQRHFCSISQGMKYDADAAFIKLWVPELDPSGALTPRELHLSPFRDCDGGSVGGGGGGGGGDGSGRADASPATTESGGEAVGKAETMATTVAGVGMGQEGGVLGLVNTVAAAVEIPKTTVAVTTARCLVDPFTQVTWMDRQELFPENNT